MVLTNMKEQVMKQSLYTVYIFIYPLIVLQIGFLLGCCGNYIKSTISEEGSSNSSPNKIIRSHILIHIKVIK